MKSEPTTLGRLSIKLFILILKLKKNWMREPDLNQRPSGYEPDELPDCSIPQSHISQELVPENGCVC